MDNLPGDETRFAFARMNGRTVLSFANFVTVGFQDGLPVFQIGVAVSESERGKGRAKHIVAAGISELEHGLSRVHPGASFYVKAVIGLDNVASQHVAAAHPPGREQQRRIVTHKVRPARPSSARMVIAILCGVSCLHALIEVVLRRVIVGPLNLSRHAIRVCNVTLHCYFVIGPNLVPTTRTRCVVRLSFGIFRILSRLIRCELCCCNSRK
jgi:hypothetical protein